MKKSKSVFRAARLGIKQAQKRKEKVERRIEALKMELGQIIVLIGQLEEVPVKETN